MLGHRLRRFTLLAALLALAVLFAVLSPFFLTTDNLLNVALQSSTNIVLAIGMTFVVTSAGIDLSVGSLVALAGVSMGLAAKAGAGTFAMLAIGLLVGIAGGVSNGVLVAAARIPPFIATLAIMSVARGVALIVTGTRPIYGMPEAFRSLGAGRVWGIPVPVMIAAVVAVAGALLLRRTVFGSYTIAMGGNEQALRLSGVSVGRWKTVVYGFMGLCCAVASVIVTARLNTAEPLAGWMFELDAIAAVVMGGTSLAGGSGNILGTVIAALILGVLRNGLTLLNIQSAYQQVALGAVIIFAVLIDQLKEGRE
ncbi:MAG: ribose ABC transporter permease [Actinobacteria bacterium]|nr:ribose ABC transporter permease [Actinomycetota bacterium]